MCEPPPPPRPRPPPRIRDLQVPEPALGVRAGAKRLHGPQVEGAPGQEEALREEGKLLLARRHVHHRAPIIICCCRRRPEPRDIGGVGAAVGRRGPQERRVGPAALLWVGDEAPRHVEEHRGEVEEKRVGGLDPRVGPLLLRLHVQGQGLAEPADGLGPAGAPGAEHGLEEVDQDGVVAVEGRAAGRDFAFHVPAGPRPEVFELREDLGVVGGEAEAEEDAEGGEGLVRQAVPLQLRWAGHHGEAGVGRRHGHALRGQGEVGDAVDERLDAALVLRDEELDGPDVRRNARVRQPLGPDEGVEEVGEDGGGDAGHFPVPEPVEQGLEEGEGQNGRERGLGGGDEPVHELRADVGAVCVCVCVCGRGVSGALGVEWSRRWVGGGRVGRCDGQDRQAGGGFWFGVAPFEQRLHMHTYTYTYTRTHPSSPNVSGSVTSETEKFRMFSRSSASAASVTPGRRERASSS